MTTEQAKTWAQRVAPVREALKEFTDDPKHARAIAELSEKERNLLYNIPVDLPYITGGTIPYIQFLSELPITFEIQSLEAERSASSEDQEKAEGLLTAAKDFKEAVSPQLQGLAEHAHYIVSLALLRSEELLEAIKETPFALQTPNP